jgi:hypothetical protein
VRGLAALALTIAVTASVAGELSAQAVPPASIDLAPGARVRVTVPGMGRFVGTLPQATNDSLRIELASGSSITLPASRLTRLELSAGVQRHGWKGAGIGGGRRRSCRHRGCARRRVDRPRGA